jgi:cytochrome o ubiquinol oxidase subunit 2
MRKHRKRNSPGNIVGYIAAGLAALAFIIVMLLRGNNIALYNSKGMIAYEQRNLMVTTMAILLAVAIPALFLLYFTAWKSRESNTSASRSAPRSHTLLVASMWLVPIAVAVGLALIMWPAAHRLDPKARIAADAKPITIQVVAMRWKWLFIYPEQHIASVNFVQVPQHTPIRFELTADEAPMSSFWIPNLGGQLYSMTGHENQLNLMGDTPGDYTGSSAEINGAGFADMKFTARVGSRDAFDSWVRQVKQTHSTLDASAYEQLLKPSQKNPETFYSATDSGLYDKVLMKYMPGMHMMNMETQ